VAPHTRTVSAPALGTCESYDNTASFLDNSTPPRDGSASKTVTVCTFNLPLTPGYWKTHLTKGSPNTAQYLPQTIGTISVSSTSIASAIFSAMNCSSTSAQNAIGCLAGHLLATELKLANHSNTCIAPTVATANAWLSGTTEDGVVGITYEGPTVSYSLTAAQRGEAIGLKNALDTYNNGGDCP
jgi:hypothetical protein